LSIDLENFRFESKDKEAQRSELINVLQGNLVLSQTHPTPYFELNRLLMESIISDTETVLCDMPEILNRW
jgi:hypothetical protein